MTNTPYIKSFSNDLESIPAAESGLYILMFSNPGDEDIYDNNIGREKVVVHSHSASIKSGKFEMGFGKRLSEYQKHLHVRRENGAREFVFNQCFYRGFVFDTHSISLELANVKSARVFESYWNCCLVEFLRKNSLIEFPGISQNHRTEWWYLEEESFSDGLIKSVENNTYEVARKIINAAEVLRGEE